MALVTLKRRAEFLAVRGGARWSTAAFLMEGRRRQPVGSGEAGAARFGFTVSGKLGNAVVRNRMRRRLREAIRLHGADRASAGWDYVVVARPAASTLPFAELCRLVGEAIERIASGGGRKPSGGGRERAARPPKAG